MSPLTAEQHDLALAHMNLACGIAYKVWGLASLPAGWWGDLRCEALFWLCDTASRWEGSKGGRDFGYVVAYVVERRCWRLVKRMRDGLDHLDPEWDAATPDWQEEDWRLDDLVELMRLLTDRERQVIERRYGLDGLPPESSLELARELRISQPTVTRAEQRAVRKMRRAAGNSLP